MRVLSLFSLVAALLFTSAVADLVPTSEFGPLIERGLEDYIREMALHEGRIVVSGPFLDAAGSVLTPSHVAAWDGNA